MSATTPTMRRGSGLTSMNLMTGSVHMHRRFTASGYGNIRRARLWLTITTFSRIISIAVVEVASGHQRDAESGEEAGRDRAEARARILFAVALA